MLCAGAVVFILGLCLFFLCLCLTIINCSTLVTAGVDSVGNCYVGCVIYLVWRVLLLLVFSVTLNLAGSNSVVVGVAEIDAFCWIAHSVI